MMRASARALLVWVVPPLAFGLLLVLFFPFRYRIEFDTDEGINAIKAMMVLRGFHLYSDIWSDQPPFFTYLLASWFRLFGLSLTAGRGLVLLLSMGVVGFAAAYLRKAWGALAAAFGVLSLLLLPYYARLSVSLMIGLPSIALAMASFYFLHEWHARRGMTNLILSALLLGLSILTKGFSVVLAPIWFCGIVLTVATSRGEGPPGWRRWLGPALWIGILALLALIAVAGVIGPQHLDEIIGVHLQSVQSEAFDLDPTHRTLESYLVESLPIFILALVGVWQSIRHRQWTALYLGGWVVLGYVMLKAAHPTWYHHQLFLTVPAAVLAAIAVAAAVDDLRRPSAGGRRALSTALAVACLGLYLWFLALRVPGTVDGLEARLPNFTGPRPGEEAERQLVALMADHAAQTHWVFTDRPIFAFLAGLPIPPNLAVITQKRMATGGLTQDEIRQTLEAYAPEMILNTRFDLPAVRAYMQTRNFTRIDETLKYRLYFRRPP
ncbi:MAG TPA: glycosyltransferase family 39 protein [Anaerolineales bacterium]|nr:glycosyltransferase family 39 protein [Anaerolineales bacterium]